MKIFCSSKCLLCYEWPLNTKNCQFIIHMSSNPLFESYIQNIKNLNCDIQRINEISKVISNQEFQEMKDSYKFSKKNKSFKPIYYAKNFMSFSKKKKKQWNFYSLVVMVDALQYYLIFKNQKTKNFFFLI